MLMDFSGACLTELGFYTAFSCFFWQLKECNGGTLTDMDPRTQWTRMDPDGTSLTGLDFHSLYVPVLAPKGHQWNNFDCHGSKEILDCNGF